MRIIANQLPGGFTTHLSFYLHVKEVHPELLDMLTFFLDVNFKEPVGKMRYKIDAHWLMNGVINEFLAAQLTQKELEDIHSVVSLKGGNELQPLITKIEAAREFAKEHEI